MNDVILYVYFEINPCINASHKHTTVAFSFTYQLNAQKGSYKPDLYTVINNHY